MQAVKSKEQWHSERYAADHATRARAMIHRGLEYQRECGIAMARERPGSSMWQHYVFAQREAYQWVENGRLMLAALGEGLS